MSFIDRGFTLEKALMRLQVTGTEAEQWRCYSRDTRFLPRGTHLRFTAIR